MLTAAWLHCTAVFRPPEMGNQGSKGHSGTKKPRQRGNGRPPPLPTFQPPPPTLSSPPPPPPPPPPPEKITFRALFDFEKTTKDDLSFKKGDILWVYKNWLEKNPNCDWWLATHQASSKNGYIPNNFVCKDLQEWFFDFKRPEAERRLKAARCQEGTFLVRPASDNKSQALSVRTHTASGERCVKHYQIRMMEDGTRCYITDKRICASIFDLIRHYSEIQDGLCTQLTEPYRCRRITYPDFVEISRKDVTTTETLGHGCFGEVYRGLLGLQAVAVKKLKMGAAMSTKAFLQEAQIMTALRHNHLVRLIGVCSTEEPLLIVTEFMVNGALLNYMKKDGGKNITLPVVIDMAAQIADGMHYLESQNFVHRDLRTANILVGEDNEVKVADFGLARPLGEDEDVYKAAENTKFPVKWTAPEAAMRSEFSPKSDVWSFGVLLYELITLGGVPYCGMSGREVLQEIQRGYRMPRPVGTALSCSQPYYDVMVTCWKARPEERPTFEHLQDIFENWADVCCGQYGQPDEREKTSSERADTDRFEC